MEIRDWPAVWLRDNCSCPECRDPGSGQKLFQITDLPADLVVTGVEEGPEAVTVTFGPDGHRGRFGREWLAGAGDADGRIEDGKALWDGPFGPLPEADWERYRTEPGERARVLGAVLTGGFAVLHGSRSRAAWWRGWRAASGSCVRPTTGGCSTSGSRPTRPTWPRPGGG